MAVDVTLNDLANLDNGPSATATINANSTAITSALQNAVNTQGDTLNGALDMNGFQILNLPAPSTVDSPVRLSDVASNPTISVPTTGTSGATVPFLNGNNTWSGTQNFTGATTTATTQSAADNSTKVATTAYADNAASSGSISLSGLSVAGNAGTSTATATSITGTANQFLGVNSGGTALGFETMSGDATLASGAITLATVNSGSGSVGSSTAIPVLTTNAKGLTTAQTTAVVIAPAGTLTGTTLASNVVTSSLNSTSGTLQIGADAASPSATTLQAESTLTGTNNQAGSTFTIGGSKGTGTGAGGSIVIKTSPAGSSGTAQNAGVAVVTVDSKGNMVHGAAIATTATDGFTYIPGGSGTPTGTPSSFAGTYPLYWDHTNKKMYIYDGSWLGSTAPGVWS